MPRAQTVDCQAPVDQTISHGSGSSIQVRDRRKLAPGESQICRIQADKSKRNCENNPYCSGRRCLDRAYEFKSLNHHIQD